jgi:hypothetical protein
MGAMSLVITVNPREGLSGKLPCYFQQGFREITIQGQVDVDNPRNLFNI